MNNLFIICVLFGYISINKCDQECSKTICYPTAGDLLIGRESMLRASSTCGLESKQAYCVVTLSDHGRDSKCSICDSKDQYHSYYSPNSHRIENVVSRLPQNSDRWWQSSNGIHNVSIEVEFVTEFQFIFTQLRFKTYRPAAMYIERSKDFGRTWQKSAYFSENCVRDFPHVPERTRNDITEVSCTSEFSSISPSEGGIVLFVATPSDLHTNEKNWTEKKNEITAITNLRVHFVRLHTFGDSKIDNNPNILNKYHYAVSEWIIRGRCSCYGHASRCEPKNGQKYLKEMVYGVCVCQHNTIGQNCEKCKDFYNDRPWLPAENNSTNECKKCQCNNHSTTCHFDSVLFEQSGQKSGGRCDNCSHNTEGVKCERCNSGYYRNSNVSINSRETCLKCKCDTQGTKYPGVCNQETELDQNIVAGSCVCKTNVEGKYCTKCKTGFWKFDNDDENGCTKCDCVMDGTIDNRGCDANTGTCSCKRFVEGVRCNSCKEGYYNISALNPAGCTPCACNRGGAVDPEKCDKFSGQCKCKPGYIGLKCTEIKSGWYKELPNYPLKYNENMELILPPVSKSGLYNTIITFNTEQIQLLDTFVVLVIIDHNGKSTCPPYQDSTIISKDTKTIVIPNKCFVKDLPIVITVSIILASREGSKPPTIVDTTVIPMLSPNNTATRNTLVNCLKYPPDSMPANCRFMKAEINSQLPAGGDPKICNCNVTGSKSHICNAIGGQCQCLSNVIGRQCDMCKSNAYGFDARGCKRCDCEPNGSLNLQCALDTGKCLCKAGVEGRQCNICKSGFWKFPFCEPCKCHGLADKCNEKTGECINCRGNSIGINCQQCKKSFYGDPSKNIACLTCQCPGLAGNMSRATECSLIANTTSFRCNCNPEYKGQFCDECNDNYYGNPREKNGFCSSCECSANIDLTVSGNCDPKTGECKKCLYNTAGFNCQKCIHGYFGSGVSRTCRKCVCNKLGTNSKASEVCHPETGKCPCLPNVEGQQCDKCKLKFYNISSGNGCIPCDCDSSNGAITDLCNSLTGQCHCRRSRGGRQCDKCLDGYWGDPRQVSGCKVCQCDNEGSLINQCNRNDGTCRCKPGITGVNCDRCARGTDGAMPNCVPCGECWVQWDQTMTNIFISLGGLQNGTLGNVTMHGLSQNQFSVVYSLNKTIDDLKTKVKFLPDDLILQIDRLQQSVNQFRKQMEGIDSIEFDKANFNLSNINKIVANVSDIATSYTIHDFEGAFIVIRQSLVLIVEEIKSVNETVSVVRKMQKTTLQREKEMNEIKLEKLESRSKQLTYVENTLAENLITFNKLTCNSGASSKTMLCSDTCDGIGCKPTRCFRTAQINDACYRDNPPTFFNAYVKKITGRNITDMDVKDDGKNLPTKLNVSLTKAEDDITSAKQLIGVTNGTVNFKYNQAVQNLAGLRNVINSSISLEEFKKLIETINNFKLSSHEDEIRRIELKIKTRIQQLDDKVKQVFDKSNTNRNECESLKKTAQEVKVKASTLLASIKNIENTHKQVMIIQSETRSAISNFDFNKTQLLQEFNQIQLRQDETNDNFTQFDNILSKLKQLSDLIEKTLGVAINEVHLLVQDQEKLAKQLQRMQLRTDNAIQKRDSLLTNRDITKAKVVDKRQPLLDKIKEFNKKIKLVREKVGNSRQMVMRRQIEILKLNGRVTEQLQRISTLEYELNTKAEFQSSCLP